jgi:glycerol dehydrogenase
MRPARNYIAAFPGKYIQGKNALAELPDLIMMLGKKGLIISSPTVHRNILPGYNMQEYESWISIEKFHGECCEKELSRLSA